MSQGYVGIVRQIYERWGRGDFRAGQELYDPYVLLVIGADFPEAGAYCGPAEISYGRFGGDRRSGSRASRSERTPLKPWVSRRTPALRSH
jgi:hypothetical protein